jgi:hypothetical protein
VTRTYDYSRLPAEERWILDQTLQTGNLNYFTNFYFRLPNSGTMWMPNDCSLTSTHGSRWPRREQARASAFQPMS